MSEPNGPSLGETAKTPREYVAWMATNLPDDATWEVVDEYLAMYRLLWRARQASAAGLRLTTEQMRERYGITG